MSQSGNHSSARVQSINKSCRKQWTQPFLIPLYGVRLAKNAINTGACSFFLHTAHLFLFFDFSGHDLSILGLSVALSLCYLCIKQTGTGNKNYRLESSQTQCWYSI